LAQRMHSLGGLDGNVVPECYEYYTLSIQGTFAGAGPSAVLY